MVISWYSGWIPSFIAPVLVERRDLYAPPRVEATNAIAGLVSHDVGEILHRRVDATVAVRHAGKAQRDLDRRERAQHHRFVEVAEMADAEQRALQRAESAAERNVELLEAELADEIGVESLRQQHGADRVRLRVGVGPEELRSVILPPGADRAPRRLGE